MGRGSLTLAAALALLCLNCSERVWLPASGFDSGVNPDGRGFGDNGGTQGGGGFGQGGRGGPGNNGGGLGGRGGVCTQQSIKLPSLKARLVFSVGKNASMTTRSFGNNGGTRLSVVQQMVHSLVTDNLNAINFGYQDFPNSGPCPTGVACCAGAAFVPPSPTTYTAIEDYLQCGAAPMTKGCGTTSDARPLGPVLQVAATLFNATDGAEHDLVLIVDGDPSCVAEDPTRSCQLAKAAQAQVPASTIIVGVGQEAATASCLSELALLGSGSQPSLMVATDPGQLNKILGDVVRKASAPSCVINLKPAVDRSTVQLFVNDHEISRDGQDGWDFASGQLLRIQVRGASCGLIQRTPESQIDVLGCAP